MHKRSVTNFDAGTKIWGGIEIYGSIHHDSTIKKYNIYGNEHISMKVCKKYHTPVILIALKVHVKPHP